MAICIIVLLICLAGYLWSEPDVTSAEESD